MSKSKDPNLFKPSVQQLFFRALSIIFLILAFGAALLLIALRFVNYFRPDPFTWTLKSAIPLILAGTSLACLQFAVPRTRPQIVLGLSVSSAFILWGVEQFVTNQLLASCIDDLVVFLFVLDLSLVVYGQIKKPS